MTKLNADANATKSCLNFEALLKVQVTKPLMTVETQLENEARNAKPPPDPNRGGDYSSIPGYIDTPAGRDRHDAGGEGKGFFG